MGKSNPYKKIQNIAVGKIAEIALKEYLKKKQIKFDLKGSTKWYEIDHDDLEIRGNQLDVKSNFIDNKSKFIINKSIETNFQSKLEWFLKCHALVPSDQLNSKKRFKDISKSIYVFAFVEGTINIKSKQRLMHAFWDYKWLKKAEYKSFSHLGKLLFKINQKEPIKLKIFGTTEAKKAVIEQIEVRNGSVITRNSYHQVFSISVENGFPSDTLKIQATGTNLIEKIDPQIAFEVDSSTTPTKLIANHWNPVDLVIEHCYLTGWITKEDFLIVSDEIPRFSKKIEQYQETKTDNFGCLTKDLNPIANLDKL
jgi:hypothetical protein